MALEALLSPVRLGPIELRNRIVSTSHQTSLVHDHIPTDDLVAYHEARARGGAGLVSVEATAVDPTGRLTAHTIAGFVPEIVPAWRKISEAVHAHGAKVIAQFNHGGRELITAGARPPAVGPSAVPSPRYHSEPRALTRHEIRTILDGHRTAAAYAREGGMDGVEFLAGLGYLPAQFLSRHTNRRTDDYGGDGGRLRFLVEALELMRAGIGDDRMVGLRMAVDEISHDGLDAAEMLDVVTEVASRGLVDYLSVAMGSSSTYRGSLWIVPPAPLESERVTGGARAVREATGLPVIATSRIHDVQTADLVIRRGDADAVGMTRALIADPDLPAKAAAGRLDEIDRCIGCNQACIGHYHAGAPINCTVNPWTGRERTLPRPRPAARTVVVVGGGPAGCAAARWAHGGRVVLFERADGLGGQWRHALAGPSHAGIARALIGNLERWTAGAEVRLATEATVDAVAAERPDLVVLAAGAMPHAPALEVGADAPVIADAWDVLAALGRADAAGRAPTPLAGPVLVWDWGADWTGMIAAEALAAAGHAVRLACGGLALAEHVHQYQRNLYLARLDAAGVQLVHHVRPVAAAGGAVRCRNVFSDREVVIDDVGTLVLAAGREPDGSLYEPLLDSGLTVQRAGDCLGARSAEEAVHEGTRAVLVPAP